MMVSCIRCSGRGTTLLTYDHGAARAYLDDTRGDERSYDGLVLCEAHAGRFTAPVGWQTVDRRRMPPSLFGAGS